MKEKINPKTAPGQSREKADLLEDWTNALLAQRDPGKPHSEACQVSCPSHDACRGSGRAVCKARCSIAIGACASLLTKCLNTLVAIFRAANPVKAASLEFNRHWQGSILHVVQ